MAQMSGNVLELIKNDIVDHDGNKVPISPDVQYVGLYFSAHWCPPCKEFTPVLAEYYTSKIKKDGGYPYEIIFISSDRNEDEFKEYFNSMPWKSLKFANRDLKRDLGDMYAVRGIPTLVIVDKDGTLITKDGRSKVSNGDPWVQKA